MVINLKNLLKNVKLENVDISIGEVVEEDDFEPMGPVPKPPYIGLRPWDYFLFKRYKPTYVVENVDEHVKNLFRLTVAGTSNLIVIAKNRLKYAYQRLGKDADIKLSLDIEAPFWISATFITFDAYVAEILPVSGFIDGLSGGTGLPTSI
jgi:CO dehydrogenase/acetyl-CoA synthase alpha subunit